MTKTLKVSKAASGDLREIYAYTLERWGERQADAYLGSLEMSMDSIIDGTALIRPLASRRKGMFKLHIGRHLIVFREPATGEILIIRVLHDRMDIESRLEK